MTNIADTATPLGPPGGCCADGAACPDVLTVTIFGRPVEITHERLMEAESTLLLLSCLEGLTLHDERALAKVRRLLSERRVGAVPMPDARWRVGSRRGDWARSIRCLLTRHDWQVNRRSGQQVCPRCWTVVDR